MPKIAYIEKRFAAKTENRIHVANQIIDEYRHQGFDLTIRQIYYQMVSRDYIPNNRSEYKKLVKTITDARLAGLISWTAIVDRTRDVVSNSHWSTPAEVIKSAEHSFKLDKWEGQPYRPEVWIEKDALRGVISDVCKSLDVPQFSCRGYTSQSEVWRAYMRMSFYSRSGQAPYIIHLGDHDPSGIDMTRDIIDRLTLFGLGCEGVDFHIKRIALNYDQVEQYSPPPKPAKLTDSRAGCYLSDYGDHSWELDALEPGVITNLVSEQIGRIRDDNKYQETVKTESEYLEELSEITSRYDEVVKFLKG